jgi:hypothetical protein
MTQRVTWRQQRSTSRCALRDNEGVSHLPSGHNGECPMLNKFLLVLLIGTRMSFAQVSTEMIDTSTQRFRQPSQYRTAPVLNMGMTTVASTSRRPWGAWAGAVIGGAIGGIVGARIAHSRGHQSCSPGFGGCTWVSAHHAAYIIAGVVTVGSLGALLGHTADSRVKPKELRFDRWRRGASTMSEDQFLLGIR